MTQAATRQSKKHTYQLFSFLKHPETNYLENKCIIHLYVTLHTNTEYTE